MTPSSLVVGIAGLFLLPILAGSLQADDPTVEDLMLAADDLLRGESSEGRITMRVRTARWQRELRLYLLSEGSEKALVRIESPPKERGTATLKVEQNIWNYLPRVDRTIKVPGSMMQAAWMGSHFTNDDLVRESRFSEDFECRFEQRPAEGADHWFVRCVPLPDAPVVWGAVEARFRVEDRLLDRVEYFDERDRLVRTVVYDDIGPLGGRTLPRRMRVVPADAPDEFTEIVYDELRFEVEVGDGAFTLQALRD